MPGDNRQIAESEAFSAWLEFISEMLGGDIFPLELSRGDIETVLSHRAIDYELIRRIVTEVRRHNAVFQLSDLLEPYPTLDALGLVRGQLHHHRGDIHQISLVDRIGELTVTFFNLAPDQAGAAQNEVLGRVYAIKTRQP